VTHTECAANSISKTVENFEMASRRSARVAARASDEEAPADAPASVGHRGIKVEGCGVKEEPASERVGEAGSLPCGPGSVSEGAAEPGPQPPASATSAQDTEAAPAVAPLGSEEPPAVRTSARLSSRKRDRLGAAAGDGDAGDGGPCSLAPAPPPPRKRGRGRSAAVGAPDPAPNNNTAVDLPHGASVEDGGGGGGAAGTGAGGAAAEPEGCLDGDAVAVRSSVQSPRGKAAKGGRGSKQGKGGPGGAAATPRRRRLDDVGGSHWRLPTHVLYDVLLFLREAEELVGIGLAFPCAMKTLRTLPDWHAQVGRGVVRRERCSLQIEGRQ
jgi:hypothetical protein